MQPARRTIRLSLILYRTYITGSPVVYSCIESSNNGFRSLISAILRRSQLRTPKQLGSLGFIHTIILLMFGENLALHDIWCFFHLLFIHSICSIYFFRQTAFYFWTHSFFNNFFSRTIVSFIVANHFYKDKSYKLITKTQQSR